MIVLGTAELDDFARDHARSRRSLGAWKKTVEAASWKNFSELRKTCGSADFVDGQVVFNIGGNKYRLWVTVDYKAKLVVVTKVQTHAEYGKRR